MRTRTLVLINRVTAIQHHRNTRVLELFAGLASFSSQHTMSSASTTSSHYAVSVLDYGPSAYTYNPHVECLVPMPFYWFEMPVLSSRLQICDERDE